MYIVLAYYSQHWPLLQTLELDPGNTVSVAKVARLEPVVAERREKMKDEMIGAVSGLLLAPTDVLLVLLRPSQHASYS